MGLMNVSRIGTLGHRPSATPAFRFDAPSDRLAMVVKFFCVWLDGFRAEPASNQGSLQTG
jgi:hypothetical protein